MQDTTTKKASGFRLEYLGVVTLIIVIVSTALYFAS